MTSTVTYAAGGAGVAAVLSPTTDRASCGSATVAQPDAPQTRSPVGASFAAAAVTQHANTRAAAATRMRTPSRCLRAWAAASSRPAAGTGAAWAAGDARAR